MTSIIIIFIFVLFLCTVSSEGDEIHNADDHGDISIHPDVVVDAPIRITVLYDNYLSADGLQTDWGFSCLIEGTEKTILFDTGTKGNILLSNCQKLDVDLSKVEQVFISHNHGDHTGGLQAFLEINDSVAIYIPGSCSSELAGKIKKKQAKAVPVSTPLTLCKGIVSTGEMGDQIKEHSLILNTSKGLVIITGCSHQGIINILQKAKDLSDKEIYLVFGGFHLLRKPDREVQEIINRFKELGVKYVGASHCTGDKVIESFKKEYGDDYIQMGVGKIIEVGN